MAEMAERNELLESWRPEGHALEETSSISAIELVIRVSSELIDDPGWQDWAKNSWLNEYNQGYKVAREVAEKRWSFYWWQAREKMNIAQVLRYISDAIWHRHQMTFNCGRCFWHSAVEARDAKRRALKSYRGITFSLCRALEYLVAETGQEKVEKALADISFSPVDDHYESGFIAMLRQTEKLRLGGTIS